MSSTWSSCSMTARPSRQLGLTTTELVGGVVDDGSVVDVLDVVLDVVVPGSVVVVEVVGDEVEVEDDVVVEDVEVGRTVVVVDVIVAGGPPWHCNGPFQTWLVPATLAFCSW